MTPDPTDHRPADSHQTPSAEGHRILLVDDDPRVLETFEDLLTFMGHHVIAVSGGHQALAEIEAGSAFDLMITDVIMPELRGPDLARAIWQLRPDLPVIFISGFVDPGMLKGIGPRCRVLRKPCRTAEISACIASLINPPGEG